MNVGAAVLMRCLLSTTTLAADDAKPLFKVKDLFESVRIANIVVVTDGSVLAFAGSGRSLRCSTDGEKNCNAGAKCRLTIDGHELCRIHVLRFGGVSTRVDRALNAPT
jgi:hypothetical protein